MHRKLHACLVLDRERLTKSIFHAKTPGHNKFMSLSWLAMLLEMKHLFQSGELKRMCTRVNQNSLYVCVVQHSGLGLVILGAM